MARVIEVGQDAIDQVFRHREQSIGTAFYLSNAIDELTKQETSFHFWMDCGDCHREFKMRGKNLFHGRLISRSHSHLSYINECLACIDANTKPAPSTFLLHGWPRKVQLG